MNGQSKLVRMCCGEGVTSIAPSIGLLILRVSAGVLMFWGHGWGKLTNFSSISANFPDPIGLGSSVSLGLATFAETLCAALIVLGVATRPAAFALVINMAVAGFIHHSQDPLKVKELALLYFFCFAALLFTGAGRISIDALMGKRGQGASKPSPQTS